MQQLTVGGSQGDFDFGVRKILLEPLVHPSTDGDRLNDYGWSGGPGEYRVSPGVLGRGPVSSIDATNLVSPGPEYAAGRHAKDDDFRHSENSVDFVSTPP